MLLLICYILNTEFYKKKIIEEFSKLNIKYLNSMLFLALSNQHISSFKKYNLGNPQEQKINNADDNHETENDNDSIMT